MMIIRGFPTRRVYISVEIHYSGRKPAICTTKLYSLKNSGTDHDLHLRSEGYDKARMCHSVMKWHEVGKASAINYVKEMT